MGPADGVLAEAIDAVFLDVGGVFHLPDHGVIRAALRRARVDVDPSRLDRAHYAGVAALTDWPFDDERIWRHYEEAYALEAGVPADRLDDAVAELDNAFMAPTIWRRHIPGAVAALRDLHSTGVALAIVSNADGTVEERLAAEAICQVGAGPGVPVAVVVDSAVVGVAKPDPGIFDFALEATGVAPERAVHVGDTVGADVDGALAAGVRPLHLDPYGFCDGGHAHLRDLGELVAAIRSSLRTA